MNEKESINDHPVLSMSGRQFVIAVVVVWLGACAVQGWLFCGSDLSVRDACGVYLPLARNVAAGDWQHSQSPMFPPIYPVLTGLAARAMTFAEYPEELAGRLINIAVFHAILACVLVICLQLWSRRVALVAMGLAAFNPHLLQMSVNVWLEPMFALVCVLSATVLILSRRKLSWWSVLLLAVLSAAAPLVRSEGIFVPFIVVLSMLIMHLRRNSGAVVRVAILAFAVAAVCAAAWTPRIMYVYDMTGYPLLDLRSASLMGAGNEIFRPTWENPISVDDLGPTLSEVPDSSVWNEAAADLGPLGWAAKSLQGLIKGWNPVVIFFAVLWLVRNRPLKHHPRSEIILGLFISVVLLASGVSFWWRARYVSVVAPLAAVFAGAGAVAVMERIRASVAGRWKTPWWGWGACSISRQLLLLAILFGICAGASMRRVQTRHSELRNAGEFIFRHYGAGHVVMTRTCEPAYYAKSRQLLVPSWRTQQLTNEQLRSALTETGASFLLLDNDRRWCPKFGQAVEAGKFGDAVIDMGLRENSDDLILFDAARLIDELGPGGRSE